MEISLKDAESILKKGGMKADKLAAMEFAQLLEEIIADIASEAATRAKKGKRKVVAATDVRAAVKQVLSS